MAVGLWPFGRRKGCFPVPHNGCHKWNQVFSRLCNARAIVPPGSIGMTSFFSQKNLTAALIAFAVGVSSLAAAKPPVAPQAPLYEALPLERASQNQLLIRAEINGKPARLLVDTGSPLSAVALDRGDYFRMSPVSAKSGFPPKLDINGAFNSIALARTLRLGSLNLRNQPMLLIDFSSSNASFDREPLRERDGFIGTDILSPLDAVLDYDRMLLVFKLDPNTPGPIPGFDYRGYRRVRMHESDGYNLYVNGRINGTKGRLMVDTGAFATLLHSQFVQRMNIPMHRTRFWSYGVNLEESRMRIANISRLSVGSMNLRSHKVGVIDLERLVRDGSLEASPPMVGLLGSEMLRRYHAIIDFGTNSLYLKQ